MGDNIYLNDLYMILLKWKMVYIYECCITYFIKMRVGVCVNVLYVPLLKWEILYVWIIYIWDYKNCRCYLSQCPVYDIIKIREFIYLSALYMLLEFLKWEDDIFLNTL
jgi:hypothetical protein